MAEAPLMNNEAARSPTGEILDQSAATTQTSTTETGSEKATTQDNPAPSTDKPADPPKPETKPAAPEAYADFKAPENYTLDKAFVETALPVFKELGLTQDQAQKLVDIQIQRELAMAKAPQETYEATRRDWQAKTQADPYVKALVTDGKTGVEAFKVDMGRALATLNDAALTTEFKTAMDITGAGDNPAFVKVFHKLAQFAIEGKHVIGAGPSRAGQEAPGKAKPDMAHAMYPNLP